LIDYAGECVDWILALSEPRERAIPDALAARYFRAISANNIGGYVPRARQVDAATRALGLYEKLGKPRRVFAAMIALARHRWSLKDIAGAQTAVEEARARLQPDWPAEFRIMHLRMDGYIALESGRSDEAVALYRKCAAASTASGDWRLEVIARSNTVDLLWQLGRLDEAAAEAMRVAEEIRKRPPAATDSINLFANLFGILSEMGRIEEATAVAREALEYAHMRRADGYFVEEWAYLAWRRGRLEDAAQLLGASDAALKATGASLQRNEARLMQQLRTALQEQLPADALEQHLAAGAALSRQQLYQQISAGLSNH
jgi:tetratricopeptide (TPR) repeat protein